MDKIEDYRKQIDALDAQIMTLLDERFALSEKIGHAKGESGTAVHDPNREEHVVEKASAYLHEAAIKDLYKALMTISKKLQKKG